MLFLPVGVTDMTTSILFPQRLQFFPNILEPALAATSVFDLPAIVRPPFNDIFLCKNHTIIPFTFEMRILSL